MCDGKCKKSDGKACGACSKSMAHAFKTMKGKGKAKGKPGPTKPNPFALLGKKGA